MTAPAQSIAQLVRYGLVGVSNTVVTLASYAMLIRVGTPSPLASAIGFGLGALNGYRLNRRWTFRVRAGGPAMLLRYLGLQAAGAAMSAAGVALVLADLAVARMGAEVVVLPVVTLFTYLLASRFVFREPTRA